MARTVYTPGKHYDDVEDLKVGIAEARATVASVIFLRL